MWQLSPTKDPRIKCQAGPLCRQLLHNGPVFYGALEPFAWKRSGRSRRPRESGLAFFGKVTSRTVGQHIAQPIGQRETPKTFRGLERFGAKRIAVRFREIAARQESLPTFCDAREDGERQTGCGRTIQTCQQPFQTFQQECRLAPCEYLTLPAPPAPRYTKWRNPRRLREARGGPSAPYAASFWNRGRTRG